MQKISIASDHNGVDLKEKITQLLQKNYEIIDLGPYDKLVSVDYPDYANKVCESIIDKQTSMGILICGTGIGMSIAANRRSDIKAALCLNEFMAERARAHNDANVLVIGSHISEEKDALKIVSKFFATAFEGGRHARRLSKIS